MNESELTIVGELRNWRRHICKSDGTFVVWGFIYDDIRNRFPDGQWIHTAQVVSVNDDLAQTITGSVYRLIGNPAGEDVNLWSL